MDKKKYFSMALSSEYSEKLQKIKSFYSKYKLGGTKAEIFRLLIDKEYSSITGGRQVK